MLVSFSGKTALEADNPPYQGKHSRRLHNRYIDYMSASAPLFIDLAGVARLADVRRPVASVWRTRFASTADPFPQGVSTQGGRTVFDAMSVARWLERTDHGNNPDAVADAAASSAPASFDIADPAHVAAVDALLTLRALTGEAVGGLAVDALQRRARAADPDNVFLRAEIDTAQTPWAEWADQLSDSAYSPARASQLLGQRHAALVSSSGTTGPLVPDAEALLVALAYAITTDRLTDLVFGSGIAPSLATQIASRLEDSLELVVPKSSTARSIRRRLLCEGLPPLTAESGGDIPRTVIMRLPSDDARDAEAMMNALDEVVLELRDQDRAIVLGPASALIDAVPHAATLSRSDALRSGRVRAIVKLPAGLITTSPREALAFWVLGREAGNIAIADRMTAIADLTDAALTDASQADLTSDVVAAMGSARDVRAHAFRFTRLIPTTSLVASSKALVRPRPVQDRSIQSKRDLPALIDQAFVELRDDAPEAKPRVVEGTSVAPAEVHDLITARHLRALPGIRVTPDEISASGLVVVGATDLDDAAGIGNRRIDPLLFAARHPSARLTVAGDIVFRTSPTARAWVDSDGSKIVAYPARVLRIDPADPGGLIPELVAADINRADSTPTTWRRWQLRRVAPSEIATLRESLADLAARRAALTQRIDALGEYTELLTAGVTAGVVSLSHQAADAASDLF